jgi:hypothetical protein
VSSQGRSSSHGAFLSFQTLFLFSFDHDRSPARSRLLFVLAVYGRDMFPCLGMKAGGPPVRLRSIVPGYAGETAHYRICHLVDHWILNPIDQRIGFLHLDAGGQKTFYYYLTRGKGEARCLSPYGDELLD